MNLPNKITTFRMVMVALIAIMLLFPYQALNIVIPNVFGEVNLIYFIVFWLYLVAALSDFVDGYLARKHQMITNYGKFMDPIADKLLVNSLLIILLVPKHTAAYDNPNQMAISLLAVIIMIARDLIVDGLRLVAASRNIVLAANIFGKIKTVLQMVAIGAVLLNDWPFALIYGYNPPINVAQILVYLAALASLLSGVIYVMQNRHILKD
ncbi:MAG: CDP-diacylglycerol--glycerol-3-phosphate 3-phosphatidyltransferase [Bacilli bacterium]